MTDTDTVTVTVNPVVVNTPPVADAGPDQIVADAEAVTLDGSGSSDADGDTLTYTWAESGGTPTVTLSGADTVAPTFTAPTVTDSADLVFTLTVSDGTATDTDSVTVTVAGECSRIDPNAADSYPAWSKDTPNYVGGDEVSHKNFAWQARNWTRQEPAFTATYWPRDWYLISPIELKWHPQRIYLGGEEADHGTRRYRSNHWTKGQNPATNTVNAWSDIGEAKCPIDHY